ncbi:hypothetical protein RAA17_06050 [Komagataeibacter rhaeticus]|nr:hypothetical protein [Komagataeibacter rhaeticus]
MTTTVMRDHAKSLAQEKQHLRVPVIGAKRPAMMEDDWLGILRSPVLVENLYAIRCRDE